MKKTLLIFATIIALVVASLPLTAEVTPDGKCGEGKCGQGKCASGKCEGEK